MVKKFFKNHLSFQRKNYFLNSKSKYIRTPKVNRFIIRTKLRARQLKLYVVTSQFLNILKTKPKLVSVCSIAVNSNKHSEILINFTGYPKALRTIHLYLNNDSTFLDSMFQPYIFVVKKYKAAFLVKPANKTISFIDLTKVSTVVLHLSYNKSSYLNLLPMAPFNNSVFKSLVHKTKTKENLQLLKNLKELKKLSVRKYNILIKKQIKSDFIKKFKHKNLSIFRPNVIRILKKTSKYHKKYTKGWFNYEASKIKRYGSKYKWRFLHWKPPVHGTLKYRKNLFLQHVFMKFEGKLTGASELFTKMMKSRERIKALFADSKPSFLVKKKNLPLKKTYLYKVLKKFTRFSKVNKKYVLKRTINALVSKKHILNIRDYRFLRRNTLVNKVLLSDLMIFNQQKFNKEAKLNKIRAKKHAKFLKSKNNHNKFSKKTDLVKLNLIQRVVFKAISNRSLRAREIRRAGTKKVLNKIGKQIAYKLKWHNYYEFKSFRWKFYKKRWYFTMSRWKRLVEFRRMLRKAWRSYRKLQKNFLFIKLLRANFKYILGMQESELLQNWLKVRRGTKHDTNISTFDYFNQSLQLKMDGLVMFLGLAPNRLMAQELVHFGGIRVNGMVVTNKNYSITQHDMIQIDSKVNQEIQPLYKLAHWSAVRARLKFTQFLQVQWSLMLFMMVRWPHNYELLSESILNQRWVRFFIRYFPVRIAKYKKAKVKWYKY